MDFENSEKSSESSYMEREKYNERI